MTWRSGFVFVLLALLVAPASAPAGADQIGLDFSAYAYSGQRLDISEQTRGNARDSAWHPQGKKLFVVGRGTQKLLAYQAEEPWQLDDATLTGAFSLTDDLAVATGSNAHGLHFKDSGEKIWVMNRTQIHAFTLSTPWDVTTAEQTNHAPLHEQVRGLHSHGMTFKPDGSMLYVDDRVAGHIFAFELSTAWDVSTAALKAVLDIREQQEAVRGIAFIQDGRVMLLLDTARQEVLQFHLDEAYDITTAEYVDAFSVADEARYPQGFSVGADAEAFYITDTAGQAVLKYVREDEAP